MSGESYREGFLGKSFSIEATDDGVILNGRQSTFRWSRLS